MSKEARQLTKECKGLIEDIFDHFDKYTEEEKLKVRNEIMRLQSLSSLLEKYDKKWQNPFEWLMERFNDATGKK